MFVCSQDVESFYVLLKVVVLLPNFSLLGYKGRHERNTVSASKIFFIKFRVALATIFPTKIEFLMGSKFSKIFRNICTENCFNSKKTIVL